jgi:hypothetical protein
LPTGTVTFLFTDLEGPRASPQPPTVGRSLRRPRPPTSHAPTSGSTGCATSAGPSASCTRARVEETLGPEGFAEAWALGGEMTIDEAAALAHEELGRIDI